MPTLEGDDEGQVLSVLQYLLDEGFLVPGFRDGEPAIFLTTDIEEAQEAVKARIR